MSANGHGIFALTGRGHCQGKVDFFIIVAHYIVWLTSSDKGVLYVVGGKILKIKLWFFILVGGKNSKKLQSYFFYGKSTNSQYICAVF